MSPTTLRASSRRIRIPFQRNSSTFSWEPRTPSSRKSFALPPQSKQKSRVRTHRSDLRCRTRSRLLDSSSSLLSSVSWTPSIPQTSIIFDVSSLTRPRPLGTLIRKWSYHSFGLAVSWKQSKSAALGFPPDGRLTNSRVDTIFWSIRAIGVRCQVILRD